ncbi:MAG TPA: CtsR family transcriptional regulator [Candidatus Fimenecus excrementavium]|nr:CtsR family transcriptional regulator [Candidatus Fimenecus excrementavium]
MNLSKEITKMILDMLSDSGTTEIKRNDLAEQLGCVPSQINYVLASRFTPEQGYIVESRRGGGGYIKITRATCTPETLMMHLINSIGDSMDEKTCRANIQNLYARGILPQQTAQVMSAAISDKAYREIPQELRNTVRASVFKQMLITTMQ